MLLDQCSAVLCLAAESRNLLLECHYYWHLVKIRKQFVSELIGFLVSVWKAGLLSLFLILIVLGRFEAMFTILMCYSNTW